MSSNTAANRSRISQTSVASAITILSLFPVGVVATPASSCAAVGDNQQEIEIRSAGQPDTIEIHEVVRFGSLNDTSTAFASVMDATFGPDGSIYVADGRNHHVRRYSNDGRLITTIGRRGNGPGEFQWPIELAVSKNDSLFVWDQRLKRFSLFDQDGSFVRTFDPPYHWLANSLRIDAEGQIVVSALGTNNPHGIHVFDTRGTHQRSFAEVQVDQDMYPGFRNSLAGGYTDVIEGGVVYGQKSPFRVGFFDAVGTPTSVCAGPTEWTTQQKDGWEHTSDGGTRILWSQYRHLAGVVALDTDLVLTFTLEAVNRRTVLRIIDRNCRLVATGVQPLLAIFDRSDQNLVGVRLDGDFQEVVVFRLHMRPRQGG